MGAVGLLLDIDQLIDTLAFSLNISFKIQCKSVKYFLLFANISKKWAKYLFQKKAIRILFVEHNL